MCVYQYVCCVYICVCVHLYVCICVFIFVFVCLHLCICMCGCVFLFVIVCLCMCVYVYIYLSVYRSLTFILPLTGSKLASFLFKEVDIKVPASPLPTTISTPQFHWPHKIDFVKSCHTLYIPLVRAHAARFNTQKCSTGGTILGFIYIHLASLK